VVDSHVIAGPMGLRLMTSKTFLRHVSCLVGVSCPVNGVLAQAPVVQHEIIVDRRAPPLTLDDVVRLADAIIVATVVSKQLLSLDPAEYVRTVYMLRVDDVIKAHELLSPVTSVYREGGDVAVGSRVDRFEEVDFPKYEIGSRLVICLAYNQYYQMFQSRFGPDGSYLLTGSAVRPMGTSPLAIAQTNRASTDFIRALKAAAGPQ